jgi:hypothetical protein
MWLVRYALVIPGMVATGYKTAITASARKSRGSIVSDAFILSDDYASHFREYGMLSGCV